MSPLITGNICNEVIKQGGLIQSENQLLTSSQKDLLWELFEHIGVVWQNLEYGSSNLKSSWLEMIAAKSNVAPSYTGEYINACYVLHELLDLNGNDSDTYRKLFLTYKPSAGPPSTRLEHMKTYVINEFIYMQVMASGFKHFGGKNYHGYVKGSRYSRQDLVRTYKPKP